MQLIHHIHSQSLYWQTVPNRPETVRAYFTYKTEPHSVQITKLSLENYLIVFKGQKRTRFLNDEKVMTYFQQLAPALVYKDNLPVLTYWNASHCKTYFFNVNLGA